MRFLVLSVICVAACGKPDCQKSDRHGLYLLSYDEQSGTCGAIQDVLVDFDAPDSGACTGPAPRWSEEDCVSQVTVTCEITASNQRIEIVGKTEQKDDDGEELEGIATFTAYTLSGGTFVCSSTYKVKYVRQ